MVEVSTGDRRRVVGVLLWLAWLPLALWTAVRLGGWEVGRGLRPIQLVAFTPYAAVAAVPVAVLAVLARRRWLSVASLASVVALAACVLPRMVAGPPAAGGSGLRLRVLTVNMRVGGADPATIMRLVRSHRVDLLALQEVTTPGLRALDAAGLAAALPYRVSYLEPDVTGLYSRFPLLGGGVRVHGSGFSQAKATLSVPGAAPVAVESVHPCAPIGAGADRWWAADLADQPPATVDGQVRLLVGDFNSTLDHAPLRRLLATGYRDAGAALGKGHLATWPATYSPLPGVTIDHVLADRRVGITGYEVHPVPRTDHRAVYAELVLPAAQPVTSASRPT
jgi:endonuclease/exonuclease/phosphatase (EEP) superfamily protein YafD